jgi:hypothetical protein
MGLTGVLIVRPTLGAKYAYNDPATAFDREYLFFMSAMDPRIHQEVAFRGVASLERKGYLADYLPNYFFINGRTFPDTLNPAFAGQLPTQPYNILPLLAPRERILLRFVGGSRLPHPLHTHGNHSRAIARQGVLLESVAGTLNQSRMDFTVNVLPGETTDSIFVWDGANLGWDIFDATSAHACQGLTTFDPNNPNNPAYWDPISKEFCPDHGKAFPVTLPENQFVVLGPMYAGTPFLGGLGTLPPGEGGLNPWGGVPFMWHSHNERELTNYNIFPGGQITMAFVVPVGAIAAE